MTEDTLERARRSHVGPDELDELRRSIEVGAADPARRADPEITKAVATVIELLDRGEVRVATRAAPTATGAASEWVVNAWVKQAILLWFGQRHMVEMHVGPFCFHDKIALKGSFALAGVRVVPPATVRHGAFIEAGAVLMPSYVNIGAWVGRGTMVDTWATVGSCAQIGRDVHLSGGVGIGGVLEPPGARPVIVEDGAFVGSRAIVVEGVVVEEEAVLAANVTLTASTPIIDVRGSAPVELRGRVPARAVVVPGVRPKETPAGIIHTACAFIIGERTASTDRKTSLEAALREHALSV